MTFPDHSNRGVHPEDRPSTTQVEATGPCHDAMAVIAEMVRQSGSSPTGEAATRDLGRIWEAAGKPKGRSPRAWLRSTRLAQEAMRQLAESGVPGAEIVLDPGRNGLPVLAHPLIARLYASTLAPEVVDAVLEPDEVDLALARRLLDEDARRKVEAEALAQVFRERARRERQRDEHWLRVADRLEAARQARYARQACLDRQGDEPMVGSVADATYDQSSGGDERPLSIN